MSETEVLLELTDVKKHFPIRKGVFKKVVAHVKAVDGVNFTIRPGETVGLVGESGCGKSTVGRMIMGAYRPTAGHIWFKPDGKQRTDIASAEPSEIRALRPYVQMVFQDPFASLNPRMTIREILAEPLVVNKVVRGRALEDRIRELVELVGLKIQHLGRYPHAFSGGQRQRISIARALALYPRLLVADEPTSALDVSVQAQIVNLALEIQDRIGLAYLFISHDLGLVRHFSKRIVLMYVGKIVEYAPAEPLFNRPLHPYTEALMSNVPTTRPELVGRRIILKGEPADPINPPAGCPFHPRCNYAQEICSTVVPELREIEPGHLSACHFAESLNLTGCDALGCAI
ncbi:MAG: ATP-binding cassette domain-containing protein [Desulfomonile tiedjei]|uniref:ATP-binding cassette domain-containing protein n=1 Tax=Desulfomonile tiedjei TaxID=2358 RepID=A0A9D6V643_9BACT|nr:ATP-binding cassette domain-containing protein [Desulfomonile tiedjei]